ncbi:hypothetical protein PSU4_59720 [Pseudonocardia sulfidoxydans NBRC 16205]|uniref:Uncharacterized protein n=1 Tax=Pseudonocardia sulfidoxydans NBRC 16205 TaxID=1223511 RepID=A0A511DV95_9PSEU|nr:hypothetical protein PSU4_59720 [Pseudonocardia sulfidoxydans NBRC 16205]
MVEGINFGTGLAFRGGICLGSSSGRGERCGSGTAALPGTARGHGGGGVAGQADADEKIEWTVSVDATINRARQHVANSTRPEQDTGGTVELRRIAGRVRR